MELNTTDYLKKALLDTQERVRDFMLYSQKAEDQGLSQFLKHCALTEAEQAQQMILYIRELS